tara:strand:+ start:68301 stop:70391 length:2091 start_codon:yes stop_codon:yes gene_type:complete
VARWKAFGAEARATFSARIGELIDHDNGAAERDRRVVTSLPDALVLATTALFLICSTLAIFGWFTLWAVIPIFVVSLVALRWLMPIAMPLASSGAVTAGIAVVGAAVWAAVQLPFASEYFVAIRDPGIYLLSGAAIANTGGSPLDVSAAHALAAQFPELAERPGAFAVSDDLTVRTQGNIGLPSLIAIGYILGGTVGATWVNVFLGAVGLLAVYGLARRLVGGAWALAPMAALALSMPYIYLSRTTYTEILTLLVMCAGAVWLISGFARHRSIDFIVAGVFTGSAALTRIDGALGIAGALLGFVFVLIGVGRTRADAGVGRAALQFALPTIALLGLGTLDLVLNMPRYLSDQLANSRPLWAGTAVFALALVILSLSPLGRKPLEFVAAHKPIAIGAAATLGLLLVGWVSRPFWLEMHEISKGPYQNAVEGLQLRDGLPIDPSRSYDEYSLWWYGWYFGWPLLLIAAVGLCLWLYWAISRKRAAHIVILATVAVSALLYLTFIKITPDQIWAFRRVLPVITPAILVGFAIGLRLLAGFGKWGRIAAGAVGLVTSLSILSTWGQIFFEVEGSDQGQEIAAICEASDGADVIALVGPGAPANFALTLPSVCDTQTVTIWEPGALDWAELASAADGRVAVVSFDDGAVPWSVAPRTATATSEVHFWQRHLLETPRTTTLSVRSVFVGFLNSDGTVTPAAG